MYAADLARAPDGRWWLLADRTQAPSGAGYALENREILEQVHPEAIPDLGVRRVRGFFGALREKMLDAAGDESPLAVILTPGPVGLTAGLWTFEGSFTFDPKLFGECSSCLLYFCLNECTVERR